MKNYSIIDVNNEIFLKEFKNILFWKRYFHRAEKEFEEITNISDEEEENLSYEEYSKLEEQKEKEWEIRTGYETFKNILVSFNLITDYKLLLDIHFPMILLQYQSNEPRMLATFDEAHFANDLFRWSELENICLCIGKNYSNLEHPNIPLLLFWYYTPITKTDNRDKIFDLFEKSWANIRLTNKEFLSEFYELVEDLADQHKDTYWEKENETWVCKDGKEVLQSKVYSMRCNDSRYFPFEDFNNLMNKLEEMKL